MTVSPHGRKHTVIQNAIIGGSGGLLVNGFVDLVHPVIEFDEWRMRATDHGFEVVLDVTSEMPESRLTSELEVHGGHDSLMRRLIDQSILGERKLKQYERKFITSGTVIESFFTVPWRLHCLG